MSRVTYFGKLICGLLKAELLLHHEPDSQDVGEVLCTSLSQVLVVYIGSIVALRIDTRMEEEVNNANTIKYNDLDMPNMVNSCLGNSIIKM